MIIALRVAIGLLALINAIIPNIIIALLAVVVAVCVFTGF